jgi:hypothetical protein
MALALGRAEARCQSPPQAHRGLSKSARRCAKAHRNDPMHPDNRARPKPWIEAIHAYVPGKIARRRGRAPLIKLSANENPLGTSPAALAAREARCPSLYPDPDSKALRARSAGCTASIRRGS